MSEVEHTVRQLRNMTQNFDDKDPFDPNNRAVP